LSLDGFTKLILSNLKIGITYSLLVKIKYDNSHFGMLGSQIGFKLSSIDYINSIKLLYNDLIKIIQNFMDEYNAEEIELIQILYIIIRDNPKLKLDNINKIKLNRDFVKIKETKGSFNSKLLPLTVNNNYYGKLLIDDTRISYLDKINKQKEILGKDILYINNIDSMYLYNDFIVINKSISNNLIYRQVYSADSGTLFRCIEDKIIDKNTFIRKIGNVSLTIYKSKILNLEIKKELGILKPELKFSKDVSNPFIGSLDLETFKDLDGYGKVYAVGYIVLNKEPKTFYLNESQDSDELLTTCIDNMLNEYNGYIFYTHNFGKFDSVFILNILKRFNIKIGFEYYILKPLYKDDKLLKLNILINKDKLKKNIKYNKIIIIDSYNLLSDKLYDLSRSFDVDVTKGYFPHKFVKRDTLNYVGNTPSIKY